MTESNIHIWERKVIPELRDLIDTCMPYITNNAGHMKLLAYLLFSTNSDECDHTRLILSERMLWNMYGCYNKSSTTLITGFEDASGIYLDYRYEDNDDGYAGTVNPALPPSLEELRDEHLRSDHADRTVYFISGKPVTPKRERQLRELRQDNRDSYIADSCEKAGVGEQRRQYVDLLQEHGSGRASQLLLQGATKVKDVIARYSDGPAQLYMNKLVNAIIEDSRTGYAPKCNTPRLFATGTSITQALRPFRTLTLSLCDEDDGQVFDLDLHYMHLAAAASLWGLEETTRFLQTGLSIWVELQNWLGLDASYKPILKQTLYSLIYGMSRDGRGKDPGDATLASQFVEGVPNGLIVSASVEDVWTDWMDVTDHEGSPFDITYHCDDTNPWGCQIDLMQYKTQGKWCATAANEPAHPPRHPYPEPPVSADGVYGENFNCIIYRHNPQEEELVTEINIPSEAKYARFYVGDWYLHEGDSYVINCPGGNALVQEPGWTLDCTPSSGHSVNSII